MPIKPSQIIEKTKQGSGNAASIAEKVWKANGRTDVLRDLSRPIQESASVLPSEVKRSGK